MNPPHNLTFHMAKRLATAPNELEYYNAVMEKGPSVEGQKVCNWYTPTSVSSPLGSVIKCNLFWITRDVRTLISKHVLFQWTT